MTLIGSQRALLVRKAQVSFTPISIPVQIASAFNSGSGASISTIADAPLGSLIIVFVAAWSGTNGNMSSVTDSAGNTYLAAVNVAPAVALGYPTAIFYCSNTPHDLPNGGTITVTNSGSAPQSVVAYYVTGANGGLDATNSGTAISNSISISTGALGLSSEIVFGGISTTANFTGLVNSSGFTEIGGSNDLGFAYNIVSSNSSVTYNPSWTSPVGLAGAVATFKAG